MNPSVQSWNIVWHWCHHVTRTFRLGEEFDNINAEFFEEPEVIDSRHVKIETLLTLIFMKMFRSLNSQYCHLNQYHKLKNIKASNSKLRSQLKSYQVGIVTSDFAGSFTMVSKPPKGAPKITNWRVSGFAQHHQQQSISQKILFIRWERVTPHIIINTSIATRQSFWQ